MKKLRKLLIATDLSPASRRVHAPAIALAKATGASIRLLHVVQVLTAPTQGELVGTPAVPPDPERDRKDALGALEEEAADFGDVSVTCEAIVAERVAQAIADYAAEHDMDAILISTHGRSGIRRLVLGSVAEGVLRHAHVPVLCFPEPKKQASR